MLKWAFDEHQLDWEEGYEGKGILDEQGNLYTWNQDDWGLHKHFLDQHPHIHPELWLEIEPDGQIYSLAGGMSQEQAELIKEADPRLILPGKYRWNLG